MTGAAEPAPVALLLSTVESSMFVFRSPTMSLANALLTNDICKATVHTHKLDSSFFFSEDSKGLCI